MVIKEILEQLQDAANPVAKILHKVEKCKVLVIGFNKGMILKEHKTNVPAKLTVLTGKVIYKEAEKNLTLNQYNEHTIPVNIMHSVEALEDSLCLLTQG